MITHATFPIHPRTKLVGEFSIPGHHQFEARELVERKERRVLMVLFADWTKTPAWEDVTPVVEIFIEQDGTARPVVQTECFAQLRDVEFNFAKKAMEVLRRKELA